MDDPTRIEAEAAAFRDLVAHLQQRTDVQNIDLMNLAGFCRNCLSKWYMAELDARGVAIDYETARERVYGMPYDQFKAAYQEPATDAQKARYADTADRHADTSGGH
ncbi:MAG: alkaline phosphatase [Xanthomonadales bacterium]|nr:alkaline phosphatase [Xanthomonadales bacterium]